MSKKRKTRHSFRTQTADFQFCEPFDKVFVGHPVKKNTCIIVRYVWYVMVKLQTTRQTRLIFTRTLHRGRRRFRGLLCLHRKGGPTPAIWATTNKNCIENFYTWRREVQVNIATAKWNERLDGALYGDKLCLVRNAQCLMRYGNAPMSSNNCVDTFQQE